MLRETLAGEKEFEESEESRSFLRQNLGLSATPPIAGEASFPTDGSAEPTIHAKPRRRRRVGKRNPKRDKVGRKAA